MKFLLPFLAMAMVSFAAVLPPPTLSHSYTTGTLASVDARVRRLATNDSAFTNLSAVTFLAESMNVSGNATVGTFDVGGPATFGDQFTIGTTVVPGGGWDGNGLMSSFSSVGGITVPGNGLVWDGSTLSVSGVFGTGATILRAYDSDNNLIAEINAGTNGGFWVTNVSALTGVGLITNGTIFLKGIHSFSNASPVASLAVDANGLTTLSPLVGNLFSGSVGINTNSPKAALDIVGGLKVNGTGQITGTLTVNGAVDTAQVNESNAAFKNSSDSDTGLSFNNVAMHRNGLVVDSAPQLSVNTLGAMVRLGWTFGLATQSIGGLMLVTSNAVAITNTTTESTGFGGSFWGATNNVSAAFWTNGRTVKITSNGRYWTPIATADTLTTRIYIGSNSVAVTAGGLAVNQTAAPFRFEALLTQTSPTNVHVAAEIRYAVAANAATLSSFVDADVMAPPSGAINVTAQWSAATPGESVIVDPGAMIEVKR